MLQIGAGLFRRATRFHQLALIAPAIRGVEDGDADEEQLSAGTSALNGIDQNRERRAVLTDDFERHLVEEALHAQQRREMGLVVDLACDVEQVLELLAEQVAPVPPGPRLEGAVCPGDPAVGAHRDVAARRVLEEILEVLELRDNRPRRRVRRRLGHRNALIAAIVSSGALRFGQWPVAFISTSLLFGR